MMRNINSPGRMRAAAQSYDRHASYCDMCGLPNLAQRDRHMARLLRIGAEVLEDEHAGSGGDDRGDQAGGAEEGSQGAA